MSSSAFRLIAGLILGIAAGLIYGWTLRPVEYINTSPDTLRADYRTDYVLMVAEAYAGDDDIELAQIRLAALGPQLPLDTVVEAIDYAVNHDFTRDALETLNQLAIALRELSPIPEIGSP